MNQELEQALAQLEPLEPHPLVWPHTVAEVESSRRVLRHGTLTEAVKMAKWLAVRKQRMVQADDDPLTHGFELDTWKLADEQLAHPDCDVLCVHGANRIGAKTYWALKRLLEGAMAYQGGTYLIMGEDTETSKGIQHRPVWYYLRKYIERYNSKQASTHWKVNYSDVGGFTMGVVQIPQTGAIIHFDVYGAKPTKWQGEEFGARIREWKYRPDGSRIENVGAVADESMALSWFKDVIVPRCSFRRAKALWPFTPINGITPSVKEVVGTLKVVKSARAKLFDLLKLSEPNIPGCPRGEMPLVGIPSWPRTRVVYFHWSEQSFGNPPYSETIRRNCEGRGPEYVERFGYGYARDTAGRAFPQFGPWNIIDEKDLPEVGTNYVFCDPHDARAWFITWVRVTTGDTPDFYIYDEWPDYETHGDWAVPTERETNEATAAGWDGDVGPAQFARVDGITGYKKIFRERSIVRGTGEPEQDPMRRRLQLAAAHAHGHRCMPVEDYYIDSRAGPRPHLSEQGQTCPVWEFDKEHEDSETGEKLPGIQFRMVSGDKIDLNLVRELMACRRNAEGLIVKPPRLYIVRRCRQHLWAAENYTGKSGEKGASKDPVDNKRYIAGADLYHVTPGSMTSWRPGEDDDGDGAIGRD